MKNMKNFRTFLKNGENIKIFTYADYTEVTLSDYVKGKHSSVRIRGEIFDYDRLLVVERPYTLLYLTDVEMYDVWLEENDIDAVTREKAMEIVIASEDDRYLYKHDTLEGDYEEVAYRVREILISHGVELKELGYNALQLRLIGVYM